MFRKSKAQSIAEYAVVMAVVIGAAVAMQVYMKRGLQAKIRAGTDAFTSIGATFKNVGGDAGDAVVDTNSQYEPYYAESSYDRYEENVTREHLGDGKIAKEKVSDLSATKAGGYSKQAGAATKVARDSYWDNIDTPTQTPTE